MNTLRGLIHLSLLEPSAVATDLFPFPSAVDCAVWQLRPGPVQVQMVSEGAAEHRVVQVRDALGTASASPVDSRCLSLATFEDC